MAAQASNMKEQLKSKAEAINGVHLVTQLIENLDGKTAKTLAHNIDQELDHSIILFGLKNDGKIQLQLLINQELVDTKGLNAGNIIRDIAKHIQGGGGGQPFYATAGGKNPDGFAKAVEQLKTYL